MKERPSNHVNVPNQKTIETMVIADREEELETFDNLDDLFASWEQLENKNITGPVTSPKPLEPESKR